MARWPVTNGSPIRARSSAGGTSWQTARSSHSSSGPLPSIGRPSPSSTRPKRPSPTGTASRLPVPMTDMPGFTSTTSSYATRWASPSVKPITSASEYPSGVTISHCSPTAAGSVHVSSPFALRSLPAIRKPSQASISCRSFSTFNLSISQTPQHVPPDVVELRVQLREDAHLTGFSPAIAARHGGILNQLQIHAAAGWPAAQTLPQQAQVVRVHPYDDRSLGPKPLDASADQCFHSEIIRLDRVVHQPRCDRDGQFHGHLLQLAQQLAAMCQQLARGFLEARDHAFDGQPLFLELVPPFGFCFDGAWPCRSRRTIARRRAAAQRRARVHQCHPGGRPTESDGDFYHWVIISSPAWSG